MARKTQIDSVVGFGGAGVVVVGGAGGPGGAGGEIGGAGGPGGSGLSVFGAIGTLPPLPATSPTDRVHAAHDEAFWRHLEAVVRRVVIQEINGAAGEEIGRVMSDVVHDVLREELDFRGL